MSTIFCLVCSIQAVSADQIDDLPDFGDASAAVISPSEEKKIGEEFMREARKQMEIVSDPMLTQYIQNLGQRLVNFSDQSGQKFTFFVVKDNSINAFAVPGGYIGVNLGLIQATQSESELASVIAHEISHITQKHIPRLIAAQKQMTGPALAAIVGAVLLGGQAGAAAYSLTSATMIDRQLSFSRDFEREADYLGIRLLNKADFNTQAMPVFFERMQQQTRTIAGQVPEFLLTHPVTSDRIADSLNRAESYLYHQVPDSLDYEYVKARVRVMTADDPYDAVHYFEKLLKNRAYTSKAVAQYGLALAQLNARQPDSANNTAAALTREYPQDWRPLALQAEIANDQTDYARAIRYYRQAAALDNENPIISRALAESMLEAGNYSEARRLIRKLLREDTDDPNLNKLLARAEGALGNHFDAHRALANYYYLSGMSDEALAQLKLAQQEAGESNYRQELIAAKIAEIKLQTEDEPSNGSKH